MSLHKQAWEPLYRDRRLVQMLLVPLLALMPDPEVNAGSELSYERRSEFAPGAPEIPRAIKAYWTGAWHPLLTAPTSQAPKIGRNDPVPVDRVRSSSGAAAPLPECQNRHRRAA